MGPLVGTLVGVLGGCLQVVFPGLTLANIERGLLRMLDPLAYRSAWVARHGGDVPELTPLIGPPVLTIATSIALLLAAT